MLEEKKKQLEQMRNLRRPIDSQEMHDHSHAYRIKLREIEQENKRKRDHTINENKDIMKSLPY